jgi:hypothetical protein
MSTVNKRVTLNLTDEQYDFLHSLADRASEKSLGAFIKNALAEHWPDFPESENKWGDIDRIRQAEK